MRLLFDQNISFRVIIRIGNATTEDIIQLFRLNFELIKEFLVNPDFSQLGCLEIGKDIFEA
jgi:hypothetical protein